jgi:hypothetical protein
MPNPKITITPQVQKRENTRANRKTGDDPPSSGFSAGKLFDVVGVPENSTESSVRSSRTLTFGGGSGIVQNCNIWLRLQFRSLGNSAAVPAPSQLVMVAVSAA